VAGEEFRLAMKNTIRGNEARFYKIFQLQVAEHLVQYLLGIDMSDEEYSTVKIYSES